MAPMCKNHPTKMATARCKRCALPMCNECKIMTDIGIYCSNTCYEAVKEFQSKVGSDAAPITKPSLFKRKGFKKFRTLIILLAVFAMVMYLLRGLSSPGDILDFFKNLWRDTLKVFGVS